MSFRILSLFFLLCNFCFYSFGQKEEKVQRGVLVTHSEKEKSYHVLEGYQVRIFTEDLNEYSGVLGIQDKEHILLDKEVIPMSQIIEFRGNNRRRHVVGKTTTLVGAGLIVATVATFIATGEIEMLTPLVKAMIVTGSVGVLATSIGATLYADKRNFKASKGWSFRISGI